MKQILNNASRRHPEAYEGRIQNFLSKKIPKQIRDGRGEVYPIFIHINSRFFHENYPA